MKYQLQSNYQHLKPLIENIEEAFQQSSQILHAERNEIRVVSSEGVNYVVKSFKVPNAINRFAYRYLRASKAKRSFDYSVKLGTELCPEAVAYIEEYEHSFLSKSYYISRHFTYDFTIRPVILEENFPQREKILKKFVEFTHQLHQKNILHRDYSPGNILIKKQPNQQFDFKIIDVNRMQFKVLKLKDKIDNFARLMVDDDTLRIFMKYYAPLVKKPESELFETVLSHRQALIKKRELKNKLRGRA